MLSNMGFIGRLVVLAIALVGGITGLLLGNLLMAFGGACMMIGVYLVAIGQSRSD